MLATCACNYPGWALPLARNDPAASYGSHGKTLHVEALYLSRKIDQTFLGEPEYTQNMLHNDWDLMIHSELWPEATG